MSKAKDLMDLWEMAATFRSIDTGLPMNIWVSTKEAFGTTIQHGPRIKVQTNYDLKTRADLMVSVTISDEPQVVAGSGLGSQDLKTVSKYIVRNKDILLAYWNDQISSPELVSKLKRIEKWEY